ncbi:MAG TPA: hypothetical protein VFS43_16555 [Polyangiaceae bacterium]|nr:hypothetical protein [Polyangiaceae bacterium]
MKPSYDEETLAPHFQPLDRSPGARRRPRSGAQQRPLERPRGFD